MILRKHPLMPVAELADKMIDPASQSLTLADCGRPDLPIIYANRGFEKMTGYTRDEAIGRNCRFLQGKGTDRMTVAKVRSAIRANEPIIVDLLNYRKDGSAFWNRLSIVQVKNDTGATTHLIGIQSDISRMRQLQDKLYKFALELVGIVKLE